MPKPTRLASYLEDTGRSCAEFAEKVLALVKEDWLLKEKKARRKRRTKAEIQAEHAEGVKIAFICFAHRGVLFIIPV